MAGDGGQPDGLDEMLKDLFDPGLTFEQSARLRRRLLESPADRERYVRYVTLHSMLESEEEIDARLIESLRRWRRDSTASLSDAWILPAIRSDPTDRNENEAPAKPDSHSHVFPASPQKDFRTWIHRRRNLPAAAICLVAIGLAALLVVRFFATRQAGTIDAVADAQWEDASQSWAPGTTVAAGRQMALQAGCVQIDLTGGAHVTVEGPARFSLESGAAVWLASGKIAALIPGGGFTVHCPHATVADLGTQFGVDVGLDGNARIEVFQGSVRAETVSESTPTGIAQILSAGHAADISAGAVKLDPFGSSPQHFVLAVATAITRLDVTDIVCGGDGTTARRGRAIDVLTGNVGLLRQAGYRQGNHAYHRVPELPAVDGCFVPDGTSGPTQVDSAGDVYRFPPTSNRSAQLIWAGGTIPAPPEKDNFTMKSTLAGVDYSRPGHGFLALHCNKGLTFDLDAIRRLHPGSRLDRFQCVVGNTSGGMDQASHRTSVVILADGKRRFQRLAFRSADGKFAIDVPLQATDHFLTLATVEAGDGTSLNWVLFGDPVITLTPDAQRVGG